MVASELPAESEKEITMYELCHVNPERYEFQTLLVDNESRGKWEKMDGHRESLQKGDLRIELLPRIPNSSVFRWAIFKKKTSPDQEVAETVAAYSVASDIKKVVS